MTKTLIVLFISMLLFSCKTVARVSYVGLPNKYKDLEIRKKIIVRDNFIYATSIRGTQHKIDTKIFEFEIIK